MGFAVAITGMEITILPNIGFATSLSRSSSYPTWYATVMKTTSRSVSSP